MAKLHVSGRSLPLNNELSMHKGNILLFYYYYMLEATI